MEGTYSRPTPPIKLMTAVTAVKNAANRDYPTPPRLQKDEERASDRRNEDDHHRGLVDGKNSNHEGCRDDQRQSCADDDWSIPHG
jgi:hypothetical protein